MLDGKDADLLADFCAELTGDAHQCRTQQLVAELVAAANLFQHLVVGMLHGFDAAERLVDSGIELRADGFHRLHVQAAQSLFHLLQDQLDAGAKLFDGAFGLEREREVVHHAEEGLDGGLHGVVARVLALLDFALAGVVELGLQAGEAVLEPVAFAAQLLELSLRIALLVAFGAGASILLRRRRWVLFVFCSISCSICSVLIVRLPFHACGCDASSAQSVSFRSFEIMVSSD